jgi:large subunit ribosomal protein L30
MAEEKAKAKAAPKAKAKAKAAPKAKAKVKMVKVTQTKSAIGRLQNHKACLAGLGLRRIRHTVVVEDTASNRGMINKVNYMLQVEEA